MRPLHTSSALSPSTVDVRIRLFVNAARTRRPSRALRQRSVDGYRLGKDHFFFCLSLVILVLRGKVSFSIFVDNQIDTLLKLRMALG